MLIGYLCIIYYIGYMYKIANTNANTTSNTTLIL